MENNQSNSPNFLHKRQAKDKHFAAQKKQVFAAFKRKPATMLMVSIETGIMRSNITWYVRKWKRQGCIHLLKQSICPISKRKAGYYTTNTHLFTPHPKLF
jgi:hypothetical protein